MSFQEKYFKYKNKYLALKSKQIFVKPENTFNELNESKQSLNFINPKIIDLQGGSQINNTPQESENNELSSKLSSELNSESNSDTISSLFNQTGGQQKPKINKKKMKSSKHFFHDKSDSELSSSSTLSEAESDSEFSSSEINW
jgi:preprotein translocase subunit SecD